MLRGMSGHRPSVIAKNFWWRIVFFHAAGGDSSAVAAGRLQLPNPLGLNLLLVPGERREHILTEKGFNPSPAEEIKNESWMTSQQV